MNKMKRFFAVFMATLMILGNGPVYAASKNGENAKSEYLKAEKKAFSEFKNDFEKSEFGKLINFTYGIDGTYSSQIDLELEIPEIKTRKYVVKENGTFTDRYQDGTVEAYVEGEKVASLELVANDNLVSVRVPELYEKYLTIDMSDLAGLVSKFVEDEESLDELIKTLPKGMMYNSDIMQTIKLTKAEEKVVKNAIKKYAKLLEQELLKDDNFEKEASKNLVINNKKYNIDVLTYSISTKQLVNGFENVWKEFKNDTTFVNLIWGKVENLYNKMYEFNMITEELPTKEQVLGAVDYFISELKGESLDNVFLKSTIYVQNGEVLRRDFSVIGDGQEISLFSVYTIKDKYYAFCTEDTKIEDFITTSSKETTHNIVLTSKTKNYKLVENNEGTSDFYYDWELVETENVDKLTVKVSKINNDKYKFEIKAEESDEKVVLEYIKNKESAKEHDVTVNFDIISGEQNIGINTRLIYKKDMKLKKVSIKGDEINLNKKSKEELMNLFEENKDKIIERAQGKFLSAFYYDEIVEANRKTIDRMNSRADKATGAQIGKATRVWFTEYSCDPYFEREVDNNIGISSAYWTRYSDLYDIEWYIDPYMTAEDDYDYYVALTESKYSSNAKIVVGVSKTGWDLPSPTSVTEVSNETNGPRVVYIEP